MEKVIFSKNQECLFLIPELIASLRKQLFYKWTKYAEKLLENLGVISEYVALHYSEDGLDFAVLSNQEWLLILQSVLAAQQNKDYIFLADILEGDLLPFLQKLQTDLQNSAEFVIKEYWEENLSYIKNQDRTLYEHMRKACEQQTDRDRDVDVQYVPVMAVNGQPVIKVISGKKEFYMHSTLNPEWEAKLLAEGWMERKKDKFFIFGMGMGYHIKALLEADTDHIVYVLEHQIEPLKLAMTYLDWTDYLRQERLKIVYEPKLTNLLQQLKAKEEAIFFLHYPSLQCIRQSEIRELLEDYFINISSMQEHGEKLERNFAYLQKLALPECGELRNKFEGKMVVIAAGGPSLDDELESLKQFRSEIVLLSVGTVARKLIKGGIIPDAIMITDATDRMYCQIEGLDSEKIPLLLLSTASKSVVRFYKGPVYLIYQQGFKPAEKIAGQKGYQLFETGGSVTTTALDVSIRFGAKEIILLGADMAFTDQRSHAEGIGYELKEVSDLKQVPAVGGGMVSTSKNLNIYRKWIEHRISDMEKPIVYNSSRGARIAGTVEKKLSDIFVSEKK